MYFGYITLSVAILLSTVSAFYSVLGLTTIFSGVFWPIVIMAGGLELGKIVATLWLHKYWKRAEVQYKLYLCSAVIILMALTSMGVFGFLSAAHTSQSVPTGDIVAQVLIFDDKINTQKDNITAARKALTQMDMAVDQLMGRTTDDTGAIKSTNLRRQQARERNVLQNDISSAQKEIISLQEQRAPVASQARKADADVGPIKYLAALIYGDNPDTNVLEKSVRWVIILIVIVFDPLALTLLLAATKSFEWERKVTVIPVYQPEVVPAAPLAVVSEVVPMVVAESIPEVIPIEQVITTQDDITVISIEPLLTDEDLAELNDTDSNEIKAAKMRWKENNPDSTLKIQRHKLSRGEIDELPWMVLEVDDKSHLSHSSFGITFPNNASRGDMFIRVDQFPGKLYKFNGRDWIIVDKNITDSYTYDIAYIDHLITKIDSGEYDLELLTDSERQQITTRLESNT